MNFNRLSDNGFAEELAIVKHKKKATLSPSFFFEPGIDLQSTQDFEFTDELLQAGPGAGASSKNYESEPLSYIHYPIFDKFGPEQNTTAVLSATVFWTGYFANVLPENVKGIVAVVENNEQTFTYRIDGEEATFLGMEDFHDTRYDHMELSSRYSTFNSDTSTGSGGRSQYTGVPVDNEYMAYSIRVSLSFGLAFLNSCTEHIMLTDWHLLVVTSVKVYPSSVMEDAYTTNKPWLYAVGMVSMFLITAMILVLYDYFVEHRQKLVLTTAEKSTTLVSALFPKTVRDRVLEETHAKNTKSSSSVGAFRSSAFRSRDPQGLPREDTQQGIIADFFPEVTILFCDIRGFTSWARYVRCCF